MAVGWYEDEVDAFIHSRIRGAGKRPPSVKRVRDERVQSQSVNSAETGTCAAIHARVREERPAPSVIDKTAPAPAKHGRSRGSALGTD
jgi:hypothetical protein